jgi:hypothetical protein
MTANDFAEALRRLVGEAEDAGLDPQEILAEIEDMAQAVREAGADAKHRREAVGHADGAVD